jgi:Uma2 family endonuclease
MNMGPNRRVGREGVWRVLGHFGRLARAHAGPHGIDAALASLADISSGEDTLVQPDLFVADLTTFKQTWQWADIRTLHLAVEVLSPSTARADRLTKRRLYQEQRIPHYWIVDVDQQQVEVWTPDALSPAVEQEELIWRHPAVPVNCTVDLRQLFAAG